MEYSLRHDVDVERVGKVVGVDGRVDGRVGGRDVDGSAGERMFEGSDGGKVVSWIFIRRRIEEGAGVGYKFWNKTARRIEFLSRRLSRF